MKQLTILVACIFLIISCKKEDPVEDSGNALVGEWKKIENFLSPGTLGSWIEVESEKRITFRSDGSYESNSTLCNMSDSLEEGPSSGSYDLEGEIILPLNCGFTSQPEMPFELGGDTLIVIHPFCFEPCMEKYLRI